MDYGYCRSCKAQVRWARSAATGKPMPLEEDAENGNVIIDGFGRAHVLRDHAHALLTMDARGLNGITYLSHHASCPQRGKWSKAPRRQEASEDNQEAMF